MCKAYAEQYKRQYVCVIPCNIYGEHDNFHLEDAHVIPALIHRAYLAKQKGDTITVKVCALPPTPPPNNAPPLVADSGLSHNVGDRQASAAVYPRQGHC